MNKKAIGKIAAEFLSVVFAVLLALGLNSYKDSLDLKKESKILVTKILSECTLNKSKIDSVIYLNQRMLEYLDTVKVDEKVNFNFSIEDEILLNSAWSFTRSSKAYQYMDNEFLTDATEVYQMQDLYEAFNVGLLSDFGMVMLQSEKVSPEVLLATSQYYLINIQNISMRVQTSYAEFLEKYQTTTL